MGNRYRLRKPNEKIRISIGGPWPQTPCPREQLPLKVRERPVHSMLKFSNVSLRRGNRLLFEPSTFTIRAGSKVGISGANGVGKSSLFAMFLKQLDCDSGEIELSSNLQIAHVAQEIPAVDKPALEYIIDGDLELREIQRKLKDPVLQTNGNQHARLHSRLDEIDGYGATSRAARLMAGLSFRSNQESLAVADFSGGWRMRLNIAQALMCRSDLLLLDEPTNHLDLDAVIWLQDWLSNYPGTLLLISHDRDFLDGIADHILHIEHRVLSLYTGNYSTFESVRAQRLAQRQSEYKKQQREITHIKQFVDRFRVQATKAKQVQSRIKALEKLDLITSAHIDSPFNFQFRQPEKSPSTLLTLTDADAGYGCTAILQNLNLTIFPGDRIGLLGRNGAGKSTLIKLLAGDHSPLSGERRTADGCQIGYFAQHQLEQLEESESTLTHLQRLNPKATEKELRSYLGGFGFSGDRALEPIHTYSGGEKSRLVLSMIVYTNPNLLLLDEPTNHLDLEMRHALCLALQEFSGAVVVVSHDRHLLRSIVDQFLLVDNSAVGLFDGDLNDYRQWLNKQNKAPPSENLENNDGSNLRSNKGRRRLQAQRREQLKPFLSAVKVAESQVEQLSSENHRLEKLLSDQSLYQESEKDRLKELLLEKDRVDRETKEVEANWLAASEALEQAEQSI